jgi:hypothetical protein
LLLKRRSHPAKSDNMVIQTAAGDHVDRLGQTNYPPFTKTWIKPAALSPPRV